MKPKPRETPTDAIALRAARRAKRHGGKRPTREVRDVEGWVGPDACGASEDWDVEIAQSVSLKDLVGR